jgi:hypothetical protein
LKKTSDRSNYKKQAHYPASIAKYEFKSQWTTDSIFDQIAHEHALQQIGNLTGTQLARDSTFAIVYIGGQTQQQCDLAISKFDILLKYHVSVSSVFNMQRTNVL